MDNLTEIYRGFFYENQLAMRIYQNSLCLGAKNYMAQLLSVAIPKI